jgi:sigma-B regulation protein RsbU (phosphoserine phosphatase)
MQRVQCAEVWGGIREFDEDLETSGVRASLFSKAADGGKGGDIYFFSVCSQEMLTRIALADVAGHGSAVTNLSEWLYGAMKQYMDTSENSAILGELNRLAHTNSLHAMTTAALMGIVRQDERLLLYAYAGHPPMLINKAGDAVWRAVRPATDAERSSDLANLPLGVDEGATFDQLRAVLAPGDRLLIYSDGVIEAPDGDDQLFGQQRLQATLSELDGRPITDVKRGVVDALHTHTGGRLAHDDVTLMALEVL